MWIGSPLLTRSVASSLRKSCGVKRRAELRVAVGEVVAAPPEHDLDGGGRDDPASGSELPLEQERHRLAHPAFVLVIALDERDDPSASGVAADDCRDDGEQFGRHREDTLPVGLGRGDDQQRDDLAVGALVLADAEVGELKQFLYPTPLCRRTSTAAHSQNASSSAVVTLHAFQRSGLGHGHGRWPPRRDVVLCYCRRRGSRHAHRERPSTAKASDQGEPVDEAWAQEILWGRWW